MPPLPSEQVCLTHSLSEPIWGGNDDNVYYVRSGDGRRSVVRQSLTTGRAHPVTTEPQPAGGIAYGGGVFAIHEPLLVYAARNRLYRLDLDTGQQQAITPPFAGIAAPTISPCGGFVAFLGEQDNRCDVYITDIAGQAPPVRVSSGVWYAFHPTFSPDGQLLAWQEWDEYSMPWEEARLRIVRLAKPTGACSVAYELLPPATLALLARPGASYAAPQFSPNGRHLAYTSDESGWRSLWIATAEGTAAQRIDTGEGEIGLPDWQPIQKRLGWSRENNLYVLRRQRSRDTLWRISPTTTSVGELAIAATTVSALAVGQKKLAMIGSTPLEPENVCTLDPYTGQTVTHATAAVGVVDPASLSKPEVCRWTSTDSAEVWGILYPAVGEETRLPPRPLIVSVHGGPTAERSLAWDGQAQYFATRGWHYLIVNYRGSSGFGRAYQDQLCG